MAKSATKISTSGIKHSSRVSENCHLSYNNPEDYISPQYFTGNKYRENGSLHEGFVFCRKFLETIL